MNKGKSTLRRITGLILAAFVCLCVCQIFQGLTVHAEDSFIISAGDGSDITAAITSALKTNNKIVISPGRYKLSGVSLSGKTDIEIDATDCEISMPSGSGKAFLYVPSSGSAKGITVKGGVWDCAGSDIEAFRFYGNVEGITLSDLTIRNSASNGINIVSSKNVALTNIVSENNALS
ncbi:MAG: hypothetical protein ACI4VI_07800, partial [Acutalibacteraceae bacterium]